MFGHLALFVVVGRGCLVGWMQQSRRPRGGVDGTVASVAVGLKGIVAVVVVGLAVWNAVVVAAALLVGPAPLAGVIIVAAAAVRAVAVVAAAVVAAVAAVAVAGVAVAVAAVAVAADSDEQTEGEQDYSSRLVQTSFAAGVPEPPEAPAHQRARQPPQTELPQTF